MGKTHGILIDFLIGFSRDFSTRAVRRQTYIYLPSCKASSPFGRYRIILLGEQRHVCVCVNNLPKQTVVDRTNNLVISSSTRYLTLPLPSHTTFFVWVFL